MLPLSTPIISAYLSAIKPCGLTTSPGLPFNTALFDLLDVIKKIAHNKMNATRQVYFEIMQAI